VDGRSNKPKQMEKDRASTKPLPKEGRRRMSGTKKKITSQAHRRKNINQLMATVKQEKRVQLGNGP